MSVAKALGAGGQFEFEGVTYKLAPWCYDVQAEFEKYFQGIAWKNLESRRHEFDRETYQGDRDALRRDIDTGAYDWDSELTAAALRRPRHQKYLLYLCLSYANKGKPPVSMELVDKMCEDANKINEILDLMAQINSDPNSTAPTS